jgi:hypothetical protein
MKRHRSAFPSSTETSTVADSGLLVRFRNHGSGDLAVNAIGQGSSLIEADNNHGRLMDLEGRKARGIEVPRLREPKQPVANWEGKALSDHHGHE